MTLAYHNIIAVIQLIVFIPCFFLGLLIISRHGLSKISGWYFISAFSLLRIIGAIFNLVAIKHPASGVLETELICSALGLAPLILLCLGLLNRVNDFTTPRLPARIWRLLDLISLVGLILAILGGKDLSFQTPKPPATLKAAIILFVVMFAGTAGILVALTLRLSSIRRGERRILAAVGISLVLTAVRLVYALLIDFTTSHTFALIGGSNTAALLMSVLEEMGVVIVCLAVGLTLEKVPRGSTSETLAADSRQQEYGVTDRGQTVFTEKEQGYSGRV